MRVAIAKEMLEDGARSVQAVSSAVGYDDVAFFRERVQALHRHDARRVPREFRRHQQPPPACARAPLEGQLTAAVRMTALAGARQPR